MFFVLDVFALVCLWWKGSFLLFKAWLWPKKRKTFMKWGWSMAFSRVAGMKSTLTCQVLTLVVKKKNANKNKKWLYECKQVLHILFLIIHRWEWKTKNKTGRLKRKSSRRFEIAATSRNINTIVLNQRKRAWWLTWKWWDFRSIGRPIVAKCS